MELGTNSSAEKSPATMRLLSFLLLAFELTEYQSSADPGEWGITDVHQIGHSEDPERKCP